jgi:broad specificity phosphatase PhoE
MQDASERQRRVDVFRHGVAAPYIAGMTHAEDFRRRLTTQGKVCALKRQKLLDFPYYNAALFSPAVRCRETAALLGAEPETPTVLQVEELGYPDKTTSEGLALSEMFSKLGQANLKAYNHLDTGRIIEAHSRLAWAKVWEIIVDCDTRRTLVVGHNIFIAAMGYIASNDEESPGAAWGHMFETTSFAECQGYSLTLIGERVNTVVLHQ